MFIGDVGLAPAIAAVVRALPAAMTLQDAVMHAIAADQTPATWAAASETTAALHAE